MRMYSQHPSYKTGVSFFINNSLILFLSRKEYDYIDVILPYLDKLTKDITYCNERFTYLIFKKIAYARENFKLADIQEELEMLSALGYQQKTNQVTYQLSSLLP